MSLFYYYLFIEKLLTLLSFHNISLTKASWQISFGVILQYFSTLTAVKRMPFFVTGKLQ